MKSIRLLFTFTAFAAAGLLQGCQPAGTPTSNSAPPATVPAQAMSTSAQSQPAPQPPVDDALVNETDDCQALHGAFGTLGRQPLPQPLMTLVHNVSAGISLSNYQPTKDEATSWAAKVGCDLGTGQLDIARAAAVNQVVDACSTAHSYAELHAEGQPVAVPPAPPGCNMDTGKLDWHSPVVQALGRKE